jgi:hypothetical protein
MLAAAITTDVQNTITVASATPFPPPNFYIKIGAEILLVTAIGGTGNNTWTVARGQLGTAAATAASGAPVTSDFGSAALAVASLFSSPAATVAFLAQATAVQQQAGLSLDAISYLLTPPSQITEGWATTSQMTPANIAATLRVIQQGILNLLSVNTTLASPINSAGQTTITVASDAGFPAPNFYIYIGSEILLVTAVGGPGNATWTVARGQQGTTAKASVPVGAPVTPTSGDLANNVIAAVAANAHSATSSPLANDVTSTILLNVNTPGTTQSQLATLLDPSLLPATGIISIGGSPTAGDTLQAVLSNGIGTAVTVSYTLKPSDSGSVNQTALNFANAINASTAFLAPCTVSGGVITLVPLTPGVAGSSITSTNTAAPGGAGHVSVSPATTQTIGLPAFKNQFQALQLFDKVGLLVRCLRLSNTELTWLLNNKNVTAYGGLDLTQLPVLPGQAAVPLSLLLTMLLAIKLERLWKAAPPSSSIQTLFDVIGDVQSGSLGDEPTTQAALASVTGWPLADIESFATALGLVFPGSYESPATYDALRKLEAMSAAVNASGPVASTASTTLILAITNLQTSITVASAIGFPAPNFYITIGAEVLLVTAFDGADNTIWTVLRGQQGTTAAAAAIGAAVTPAYGAQIVSWGAVPADEISAENMAASALGILKAQQPSEDAWLALAPTLMNPIRQNQSSALQAWLIAQRDGSGNLIYDGTDGLFNYFLIDTQMTSCELTSRDVQAYIAVQIFVERCLMNLEAPAVVVDLSLDDTWNQWQWMKRYRIWEANREVFLYPENWLIESQRPNRTEIYQRFEQEVRQGQSTTDYLETVVLNYVDRLDGLAYLLVTGTCQDQDGNIYVVARTLEDPPTFYLRSFVNGAWGGWMQIPLDIKTHQVVPAVYRGRICLFWPEVKLANEPQQQLPAAQPSPTAPSQNVDRYVIIGVYFSIFRNGSWAPAQTSKGKFFDKPLFDPLFVNWSWPFLSSQQVSDTKTIEALYTIKVQSPAVQPGYGLNLFIDVFRLGAYSALASTGGLTLEGWPNSAVQVGRAVFNGRFSDLELREPLSVLADGNPEDLLSWAQATYGPDAQPLLPLTNPDPDLTGEPYLLPQSGALLTGPAGANPVLPLTFTSADALEQNVGKLLNAAQVPFRVVGPVTDLAFDPTSYFFFEDNRRCYLVESQKYYQVGSMWSPVTPSDPGITPYQVSYWFHVFYHPFTRLFWNQLSGGGFDLLYDSSQQYPDQNLQENPDQIDPSGADQFSFGTNYQPVLSRVNWDHDDVTGQDRQFLDFSYDAAFSVYNWELFYHIPLFIAQLLSQNQQFEDAQSWFHYIFNPTRQAPSASTTLTSPITDTQTTITVASTSGFPNPFFPVSIGDEVLYVIAVSGPTWTVLRGQQGTTAATAASGAVVQLSDPAPQRFWIPKPLHNLTSTQILAQQIKALLAAVNQGDPTAAAQVEQWRQNSFNPFLLADLRQGVPYMKSTVMSYLDNLIAWGDNLFSTESREALSEATLLYVLASEILGPTPAAVTPPSHADKSFDQLESSLDAFANAMVEIENVIGGAGITGAVVSATAGGGIPAAQTFYFKIPPNATLLNYWTTVADRLLKLRNCQNIAGAPLQLALFDAPIDPGLLIAAQAAGVDLSSVLSDVSGALPNYRFTSLYPQALDFVNAVRAYGASLQAALEKIDAGALALLQQTTQQQLLTDGSNVLDWQVQQAQDAYEAAQQTVAIAQQKYTFNTTQSDLNAGEAIEASIDAAFIVNYAIVALAYGSSSIEALIPQFSFGAAGFGGSPTALAQLPNFHASSTSGAEVGKAVAAALDKSATLASKIGTYERRRDNWNEAAAEANIQITQAQAQLDSAKLALQIAQENKTLHQKQIDNIQKQIDFLNDKFTSDDLYNWMIGSLSATYFHSYQLAYQLCKQLEHCYQFELGISNSSFIQFGYWDSLHKGLLAGESLNQDLRRLQASYLQQNARRFELSRFVSLGILNPVALQQLLVTGACDFTLPESLFDNDYPGHFNRRLTRVSLTVVYPNPGKFDNVKATLTMCSNQVRIKTDTTSGYAEQPAGSDARFVYNYAAVPQKIAMGNAQDDPGLFLTSISNNIADQRYLPFENAGAISSWHLEIPQANNEIDLSTVGDVVLHLHYTALDGGDALKSAAQGNNAASMPTSGVKVFSAQNDFVAPPAGGANSKPVSPWQAFLYPPTAGGNQVLTLPISPSKFPAWTHGHTITITSLTVLVIAWPPGTYNIVPQAPLPTASVAMTPVPGMSNPTIVSTTFASPGTLPAIWSFQIQQQSVNNFTSLTPDTIGDVLLLVSYQVS